MGYKLVNCPERPIEIVKFHLYCVCFVYEEWIVCKGLRLFDDCFCKICLNVWLEIFVAVVSYKRSTVICLWCKFMFV